MALHPLAIGVPCICPLHTNPDTPITWLFADNPKQNAMDCATWVFCFHEPMNREEFLGLLENFCKRPALYNGFTDYKSAIC